MVCGDAAAEAEGERELLPFQPYQDAYSVLGVCGRERLAKNTVDCSMKDHS